MKSTASGQEEAMTTGARAAAPNRQARRRAATYDEIVAGARALLDEGQRPTVRGVAARIGASPAGLYRYVSGHDELLDLVAAAVDESATREVRERVERHDDPLTQWLAAWIGLRQWAFAHAAEFRLLVDRPRSNGAPIRELSDAWLGRLLHAVWATRGFPLPQTPGLDLSGLAPRAAGVDSPSWPPGLVWLHARICSSLHGLIALELSGYAEPALVQSAALFRSTLLDWLARFCPTADLERLAHVMDDELGGADEGRTGEPRSPG
jgi:AcrR family transcriptional regulator